MSRFVRTWLLPLTLALALLAAACAPAATPVSVATPTATNETAATPTAPSAQIGVTDGLGREVTLDAPATKIVSLAPSNTEIVFALGAGDRLIGRDDFSDYPPDAAAVPSIGSLYPSVNAEAVVALEPDLVLAAGITNPEDVQRLADLGLTVYSSRINTTLEDIYADIADIGRLIGRAEEADAMVADMRARVAAVTTKTSAAAEKPVVFYEIDATEPSKPWTPGPNSFIGQLVGMAGGTNAGDIATDQYAQLSLEQLVAQDPEVIILGSATYGGQTPELVAQRTGWETLSAVQNGAVYTFDDNLVSRPGPRVVDGLEELARLIHPDLFE